jgi:hypothetical protein
LRLGNGGGRGQLPALLLPEPAKQATGKRTRTFRVHTNRSTSVVVATNRKSLYVPANREGRCPAGPRLRENDGWAKSGDWVVERRFEPSVRFQESGPGVPLDAKSEDVTTFHSAAECDYEVAPGLVLVRLNEAAGRIFVSARYYPVPVGMIENRADVVVDKADDLFAGERRSETSGVVQGENRVIVEDLIRTRQESPGMTARPSHESEQPCITSRRDDLGTCGHGR